MSAVPTPPPAAPVVPPVNYVEAAKRHMTDADALRSDNRQANAGQLYGFVAECGLKALLIVCGVTPDANGEIPARHRLRQHVPHLPDRIVAEGHLIPDVARAGQYLTSLAHLDDFKDWSTDHRYWRDAAIPVHLLSIWKQAAEEILQALDQAKAAGVLT